MAETKRQQHQIFNRLIAKLIDFLIAGFVAYVLPVSWIAAISGLLYLSIADGLALGRSIGKRVIGLRVRSEKDGTPCDYYESALRNIPIVVVMLCSMFPVWNLFLVPFVALPILFIEISLMFYSEDTRRIGDVLADTRVITNTLDAVTE